MPVSENVTRFVTSFMQAVEGCGPVTEATRDDDRRITHVLHADGCPLDIPDEALAAMTQAQLSLAFGTLPGGIIAGVQRQAATPPVPVSVEVGTEPDRITRATERPTDVRNSVENSSYGAGLAHVRTTENMRDSSILSARGKRFRQLLTYAGVTLPAGLDKAVGYILNAMYCEIESKAIRLRTQNERLNTEYQTQADRWQAKIDAAQSVVQGAVRDAANMTKLREAAIAWRDDTSGDANSKFEKFTALMNSVDAVQPAPAPVDLGEALPRTLTVDEEATVPA